MDLIIDVEPMYEDIATSKIKVSFIVKEGQNIEPHHYLFEKDEALCDDKLAQKINEASHIYFFDSVKTIDFMLTNKKVRKEELIPKAIDLLNLYNIKPTRGRYIRMLAFNSFIEKHGCSLLWMLKSAQEIFKTEFYSYDTRYTVASILRIVDAIIPDNNSLSKQ